MKKRKQGEFGYLNYLKMINLIKTIVAFVVVLAVLLIGIAIFKTKTNYLTVLAVVLVLPAAKMAVAYFVLVTHKACSLSTYEVVKENCENINCFFDCIVSNEKKPIGTQAVVITDSCICALTNEKADKKLFEKSVTEFLKADKLSVNVTLYTDEKSFLNRIKGLSTNFDKNNSSCSDRMEWNSKAFKNMCL